MIVSVVVPVYNSADTIAACLGSILAQTMADLELVVVDDGSTDGSGAMIDAIALNDRRVCAVHQPNRGRTEARRVGVGHASGEWVSFVDSDDTLPPDALSLLVGGASADTDIVFGNGYSLAGEERTAIGMGEFRHLAVRAEGTIGTPWGCLFRRSVLTDRLFDLPRHIMMGEDYIFWLRLVFSSDRAVSIVREKVYAKGAEHTSNCFRWTASYAAELDALRRDAVPAPLRAEYVRDMLADRLENMLSVALWSARSEWRHSAFYRGLLADMRAEGMSMGVKARLFLSMPSLRLRRLFVRASNALASL